MGVFLEKLHQTLLFISRLLFKFAALVHFLLSLRLLGTYYFRLNLFHLVLELLNLIAVSWFQALECTLASSHDRTQTSFFEFDVKL